MEPVVDQRIYSNRYQLTHLIARGGMAMVYRAHDLLLNRYVALKLLYPELSVDQNFVERFRREAQAAANLSHPNIVPVFDWGEEGGTYFIVMELIEGTSLADLLRESRTLSPAKSAQVCAQVASALSYAHRQGVVHRDVKPGNILLTSDGQVKVTDFGIAQAVSTEDHLTVAGSVMGTATYFSPEQAEGSLVDGRSDVYSLGVVLYELLAGRPPFIGETPVSVASKHVREVVPSPRQFNPSLPSDLEAISLHTLAKRPEDRYQTADELRSDLLRFVEGQPVSVAGRGAIMGDDVTQAVSTVAAGERTASVAIMSGPRTDIRPRRKGFPAWLAVVLVVLLAGGGAAAYVIANSPTTLKMPNVVGLKVAQAESFLRSEGLNTSTQLEVSPKTAGTVLRTKPEAGKKVQRGQLVTIYISQGQTTTPVNIPSVVGLSLVAAESQLAGSGLGASVSFTNQGGPGDFPGNVIQQNPSGGTQGHTGEKISLIVLSLNSTYPVPDVSGDTPVGAASALGNAGLGVTATNGSVCSNTKASGIVVSTVPAAGQPVSSGTKIKLIVSSGYCTVIVPTVQGETQANASAALEAQGLMPQYTYLMPTDPNCLGQSDYVVDQTPLGGSSALFKSTVTMDYCPPTG